MIEKALGEIKEITCPKCRSIRVYIARILK